jgi:hypothetical protein
MDIFYSFYLLITKIMQTDLPIPETVYKYSEDLKKDIFEYLEQLNETEKKIYIIAFQHLGSSFHITRTNGFQEWRQRMRG